MTYDSAQNVVDKLDNVLEQERLALLDGNLVQISELLEQKETLIDTLKSNESAAQPELQKLQDKVARNQALLDGALQGIRTVAARVAAFRKIRRSLDTYDEKGRKQTISGVVDFKMEKRA